MKKVDGLKCPWCGCRRNKVTNTYQTEITWRNKKKTVTHRRRCCDHCGMTFNTHETVEVPVIFTEDRPPPEKEFDQVPPLTGPNVPKSIINPFLPTSPPKKEEIPEGYEIVPPKKTRPRALRKLTDKNKENQ